MCSGIIEMRPAELTWLHTVLGLQRPVMTPNLIISVKRCWSWDFSMIHASTKQQLSKGVLGKNLLPGVGKFFWPPSMTIHTHTHTPSPAIYGNIAHGFSILRHHATKDLISLTAWLLGAPVCTVLIQAIWVKTIKQNPIYNIFSKKFPWFN